MLSDRELDDAYIVLVKDALKERVSCEMYPYIFHHINDKLALWQIDGLIDVEDRIALLIRFNQDPYFVSLLHQYSMQKDNTVEDGDCVGETVCIIVKKTRWETIEI